MDTVSYEDLQINLDKCEGWLADAVAALGISEKRVDALDAENYSLRKALKEIQKLASVRWTMPVMVDANNTMRMIDEAAADALKGGE